ncbi:galactokinase [Thermococcus cleftensis]|uniref:Galactokinase n=1 Tax=Thermococcus cleftensis (strain DSM 27260 / KACC 17922 / CL1) TaxID=163003 RepID=I3ZV44_THECF|nr:galactokinase [Thermococcus cleftensis]AFL95578.1 galactokinase [Thermococcus cleftensis]
MYRVDSPGRVNLIGDHTDYALGYVMPVAINLYTVLHAQKDEKARVYSQIFREVKEFDLEDIKKANDWADYVRGIFWVLRVEGYKVGGMRGILGGDLPIGSGLGSSASIEIAVLAFLNGAYGLDLLPIEMALLAQKAENDFVGVPCGILDQFAVVHGKKEHVIFLDTDTLRHEYIRFPGDVQILVFYTGVKRELSSSAYAERRKVAEETLRLLGKRTSKEVEERELRNLPSLYRRFFGYIVRENRRVLEARDALKSGDLQRFGELMTASHWDLARNYDVSSEELDFFVRKAVEFGAYGAKLTGAGFGGSAVAIVPEELVLDVAMRITDEYVRHFNWEPDYHLVSPSDGVRVRRV